MSRDPYANPPDPVCILMAEDDADDALLAREALDESRIANELVVVGDGVELMDYLQNRGRFADPQKAPLPGLILLDLNMPRMNGFEFLAELRRDERLKRSIVFVLTTSARLEDKLAAYEKQVAGYILKSQAKDDFLHVIALLQLYQSVIEFPPQETKAILER